MAGNRSDLFPSIRRFIDSVREATITANRRERLRQIIEYGNTQQSDGRPLRIQFICTHNSRRSQMAQVWAKATAYYFGLELLSYSGGTQATEFHPNARQALQNTGFRIESGEYSSGYKVYFSDRHDPVHCFSKRYDHPNHPDSQFIAVMTCSEADEDCPFIPGAERRILLPYDDPGQYDDTPEARKQYEQCCRHIATEMVFVMSKMSH